jgi:hypothetical protein
VQLAMMNSKFNGTPFAFKERKRKHDEVKIANSSPVLGARPEKTKKKNVGGFLLSKRNSHLSCSSDRPFNVRMKRKRTSAAK